MSDHVSEWAVELSGELNVAYSPVLRARGNRSTINAAGKVQGEQGPRRALRRIAVDQLEIMSVGLGDGMIIEIFKSELRLTAGLLHSGVVNLGIARESLPYH